MKLDFAKGDGLLPAIVQDYVSGQVLMLGYMNEEAYQRTLQEGVVTFFSRTKNRLWTKGESSGNFLTVKNVAVDCDNDTVLVLAEPQGPTCHTGQDSCFGDEATSAASFLFALEGTIGQRQLEPSPNSYTKKLFEQGGKAIAQKVGEEATELIIAALGEGEDRVVSEAADLLFHMLILLRNSNISLKQVIDELKMRSQKR